MTYTVAANTGTARTGTLTIAGQTVTVTQAGSCNYTVAPTTQSAVTAGGSYSTAVTTTSGCGWTGVSNSTSWITVTSGSSGTGDGTVTYNVAARTPADLAHGDADDCGTDGHGHAVRHVQLHDRPNHAKRRDVWRLVLDGGHDDERLRLDRRQQ